MSKKRNGVADRDCHPFFSAVVQAPHPRDPTAKARRETPGWLSPFGSSTRATHGAGFITTQPDIIIAAGQCPARECRGTEKTMPSDGRFCTGGGDFAGRLAAIPPHFGDGKRRLQVDRHLHSSQGVSIRLTRFMTARRRREARIRLAIKYERKLIRSSRAFAITSLWRRLRVSRVLTVILIFVRVAPASVDDSAPRSSSICTSRQNVAGRSVRRRSRPDRLVVDLHPHLVAVDGDDPRLVIGHEAAQLFDRDPHRHRRDQMLLEEIVGPGGLEQPRSSPGSIPSRRRCRFQAG